MYFIGVYDIHHSWVYINVDAIIGYVFSEKITIISIKGDGNITVKGDVTPDLKRVITSKGGSVIRIEPKEIKDGEDTGSQA